MITKRIILSAALLIVPCVHSFAEGENAPGAIEKTILKLEQQWDDALTKSDTAALGKLYDESIIYTHSNGKVDTKVSYLNAIKSGATKYQSMKREDIKVQVYGQSAVVACHWEVHVLAGTNKIDTNARYLHVYVHQKDGWKMVAHQSTKITP